MTTDMKFQLVRLEELEDSFKQPLTRKDMKSLADSTGIPQQFLIHEIVFAAPKCQLTTAYMAWQQEVDVKKVSLRVKTLEPGRYVEIHGQDSLKQFYSTMKTWGHPFQPVRSVRDSRHPVTDSLDSTHTYVADP